MNLANKVAIALLLGIVVGLVINSTNLAEVTAINKYFLDGILHVGGQWFINALKMLVVPLVLFSLIPGLSLIHI